ncbi:carbohydrate ABC transporter permease [Paenibacillus pinistramenti]|uniref:carbohydrate ABC transporter permease n=1 Tax=Paenibacillus pinistramenti TaxID=1768003 RepID=UPI00110873A6|nr:sugar ABC transporter permease [Paenibacillus pinistramenti]
MSELDKRLSLPVERTSASVRSALPLRAASLKRSRLKENALAYAFLAPSLLLFAVFLFYPLVKSVYLSLHSTDPAGRIAGFTGFDNYSDLFTSGLFVSGIKTTALFALLTVPAGILLALILAVLTHNMLRGKRLFQFAFSLPMVISVGSASVIWKFLFHPTLGMLNYLLEQAGMAPVGWLIDPHWALLSISIMTVWMNLGFNYILLSSGMQGIPDEIYESARIDGAGPLRVFYRITMPLLSPTLFFVLVVSTIGAFQSFGQINILTQGGPMNSTSVFVYSIYQESFINFRFGTGSAQAILLFLVIMLLTLIQFKWVERKVHYQ